MTLEGTMKETQLYFPREERYGKRIFKGNQVHTIKEEVPGFINRWVRRGCTEVPKVEVEPDCGCTKDLEKEEEILAERRVTKKKVTKKKVTKKKSK